jgi:molybdopterin/thiamine biosynthesis adenylyltransferase
MSTLITGAGLIGCQTAALLAAQGAVGVHLTLGDGTVVVSVEATELH